MITALQWLSQSPVCLRKVQSEFSEQTASESRSRDFFGPSARFLTSGCFDGRRGSLDQSDAHDATSDHLFDAEHVPFEFNFFALSRQLSRPRQQKPCQCDVVSGL